MKPRLKSLSNIQIDNYYQGNQKYGSTYSRNNLPNKIQSKCYVINLDGVEKAGSHWVAVLNISPQYCYYFDSYGITDIPIEVEKFMRTSRKTLQANHIDLQAIDTDSCGEWCVYFIDNMIAGRAFVDIIQDFTTNPAINEHILFEHFGLEAFTNRSMQKSIDKHNIDGRGIKEIMEYLKKRAQALKGTIVEGVDRIKGFIQGPREAKSPLIRSFLERHGNENIIAIRVCRSPILGLTEKIANMVSLGKWEQNKKELNYDKMFHLYLLLRTNAGSCYRLDKSQNLNIATADWNSLGQTEYLPIITGSSLTFNNVFANAEAAVDHKRLYMYHPTASNCQVFVHDLLKSSNLLTPLIDQFVMQDSEKVLNHLPMLKQAMAGIVNLASRSDILMHGNGLSKMLLFRSNK